MKSQKPKPLEFRLRLSPELKAIIERVRGKKSINQQINEWLWSKVHEDHADKRDHADQLAGALRPILDKLNDEERDMLVANTISSIEIFSALLKRSRWKKKSPP